jgi:signal transduction histidine kinase
MNLKEHLIRHKEAAQLIYGAVLIILVPSLIVFNTVFIIKKYNQSLDLSLQRQALSVGRSISTLMENDFPWVDFIQLKIDALMASNLDIQEISVLKPAADEFEVIASSNRNKVGAKVNSYYYKLAWLQPGNNGLATDSLKLSGTLDEQAQAERSVGAETGQSRFWLVAMPMKDASGLKQAMLTIRLSSKIIDDATTYNRNLSIYLLIGTVFIVIMFLLVAVRMWDYVLLYRRIKAVDQMKDEFIAMASHELRSPVAGIRGYISMILDGTLGPINQKTKDCLKTIQGASERLTLLVEDLLDVNKIEQGRIKLNLRAQDPLSLIEEATTELRAQAEEKKLEFGIAPFIAPSILINIDANYFKQILINLLSNAIKYTETGTVEVVVEERENGQTLEIKVKDSGIGMNARERTRLFEKFFRVRNDKTRHIACTGLGLWITKQLVELMKGSISIESIEGVGTQVTLRFPIIKNTGP